MYRAGKIIPLATLRGELRCNSSYSGEPEPRGIIFLVSGPFPRMRYLSAIFSDKRNAPCIFTVRLPHPQAEFIHPGADAVRFQRVGTACSRSYSAVCGVYREHPVRIFRGLRQVG